MNLLFQEEDKSGQSSVNSRQYCVDNYQTIYHAENRIKKGLD